MISNVLCLCPNDHVLFDKGAIYIADGMVYRTNDGTAVQALRTHTRHALDDTAIRYHRERFAGIR